MILKNCKKGHYFDGDKFAECPYCSLVGHVRLEATELDRMNALEETQTVVGQHVRYSEERKP